MTSIRLIQVGLGRWGLDWATRVLPKVRGVEVVGCVDINPAALALARQQGAAESQQCFDSLDGALAELDADAVLVTTNLDSHVPVVMSALEAGRHVLVEKPFAPSISEARKPVTRAKERGLTLMVSHNYRFYPVVRAVQEVVLEGRLGDVLHVDLDFRRYSPRPDQNADPGHRVWRQPLLLDMSIHHFDLLRAVLDKDPLAVNCRAWNPIWSGFRDPPEASATIDFGDHLDVSYRATWLTTQDETLLAGEWRMEFEQGELSWTSRHDVDLDGRDVATLTSPDRLVRTLPLPQSLHIDRAGVLEAFIHCIGQQEVPETSGQDNLGTLLLTFAAIESAARREQISLHQNN